MQKLKLQTTLKIRGLAKVTLFAILMNQVLTTAFSFFVQKVDPAAPESIVPLFSFVTTILLATWIQTDARRAYMQASKQGCIRPVSESNPALHVAPDCPKRWLVILYIEINPGIVGL
ncbi:hypothetical protein [Paraburkholderia metrosideri]|jgi:hypothetical protein|uniref:Uncharacterized protein n=1 Tax=Paraburkholderia metrosideri TaxID=580937 RepID=A0ABN7ID89_9BURK|nr:hypothetical protein [Paraburkholderia metrosideri]CAD6555414.1 hypothetical protein LMG28140_05693 [Paraburkholderia metrosideri]